MRDRKKIAAIMAAVANLRAESQESRVVEEDSRLQTPDSRLVLWRVSGRQEIMQMRALWQRRIVPR